MVLDRWPDKTPVGERSGLTTPIWQRWFTALVNIVNGLTDSAASLAVLIAANTAAIAAQAILVAANTAAIVLLQPVYGTWTPIDSSGAALTFTTTFSSFYIRIGRLVYVSMDITYPVTANAAATLIGGLPFTTENAQTGLTLGYSDFGTGFFLLVNASATTMAIYNLAGTVNHTNAQVSGKTIRASGTYRKVA